MELREKSTISHCPFACLIFLCVCENYYNFYMRAELSMSLVRVWYWKKFKERKFTQFKGSKKSEQWLNTWKHFHSFNPSAKENTLLRSVMQTIRHEIALFICTSMNVCRKGFNSYSWKCFIYFFCWNWTQNFQSFPWYVFDIYLYCLMNCSAIMNYFFMTQKGQDIFLLQGILLLYIGINNARHKTHKKCLLSNEKFLFYRVK